MTVLSSESGLVAGVQALLPRLTLYTAVALTVLWIVHISKPAFEAAMSRQYRNFEWIDGKVGVGAFMKSNWDTVVNSRKLWADIHHQVVGANNSSINLIPMPHHSTGFMLMVPKMFLNEYVKQPEHEVSLRRYALQALVPEYSTLGPHIIDNPMYRSIVHKELYQKLPGKMEMVNEEMESSIRDVIESKVGPDGKAHINVWDTASKLLSRSANRVISGYPLCRNQEYQDATAEYGSSFMASAAYARIIPPFLRPILLPLVCRPLHKCIKRAAKEAAPVIEERMLLANAALEKGEEPNLPSDILSSVIITAKKDNNPAECDPVVIASRMMVFNFLQAYTNLVTLSNLIYDLISLPKGEFEELIADLRTELNTEMAKGDTYSNEFFQRLDLMDSFIRESIRYNPIGETGLERIVCKKEGFTFSDGTHIPRGALLGAPIKAYQRDESVYPGGFNPRRSMRDPEHPKVTDISPSFLNFGLGRGACPGRWFTNNLLKLVLTHLILEYDFERLEERPENVRKVTLDEPCAELLITLKKRETS